jgi:hypothetical protein
LQLDGYIALLKIHALKFFSGLWTSTFIKYNKNK